MRFPPSSPPTAPPLPPPPSPPTTAPSGAVSLRTRWRTYAALWRRRGANGLGHKSNLLTGGVEWGEAGQYCTTRKKRRVSFCKRRKLQRRFFFVKKCELHMHICLFSIFGPKPDRDMHTFLRALRNLRKVNQTNVSNSMCRVGISLLCTVASF